MMFCIIFYETLSKPVVEPLTSDRASCNSVIIIMFSINLAFLLILSLWLCEIFFDWMSRTNNEYLPASKVVRGPTFQVAGQDWV